MKTTNRPRSTTLADPEQLKAARHSITSLSSAEASDDERESPVPTRRHSVAIAARTSSSAFVTGPRRSDPFPSVKTLPSYDGSTSFSDTLSTVSTLEATEVTPPSKAITIDFHLTAALTKTYKENHFTAVPLSYPDHIVSVLKEYAQFLETEVEKQENPALLEQLKNEKAFVDVFCQVIKSFATSHNTTRFLNFLNFAHYTLAKDWEPLKVRSPLTVFLEELDNNKQFLTAIGVKSIQLKKANDDTYQLATNHAAVTCHSGAIRYLALSSTPPEAPSENVVITYHGDTPLMRLDKKLYHESVLAVLSLHAEHLQHLTTETESKLKPIQEHLAIKYKSRFNPGVSDESKLERVLASELAALRKEQKQTQALLAGFRVIASDFCISDDLRALIENAKNNKSSELSQWATIVLDSKAFTEVYTIPPLLADTIAYELAQAPYEDAPELAAVTPVKLSVFKPDTPELTLEFHEDILRQLRTMVSSLATDIERFRELVHSNESHQKETVTDGEYDDLLDMLERDLRTYDPGLRMVPDYLMNAYKDAAELLEAFELMDTNKLCMTDALECTLRTIAEKEVKMYELSTFADELLANPRFRANYPHISSPTMMDYQDKDFPVWIFDGDTQGAVNATAMHPESSTAASHAVS